MTPDFGSLAAMQYRLEGAFRAVHTRLRTHAESVAFFGGGAAGMMLKMNRLHSTQAPSVAAVMLAIFTCYCCIIGRRGAHFCALVSLTRATIAAEGSTVAAAFEELMAHLRRVSVVRWGHAVADDFFSKQLPNNITWLLTLMYSLNQTGALFTLT